jgi:autotransporter-associated beta strand protein
MKDLRGPRSANRAAGTSMQHAGSLRWGRRFERGLLAVVSMAVIPMAVVVGSARVALAASPELRATWLTTTASDDLLSSNIATTMASLRQVGLNTVYVEAWKNGYTNYNSPTLANFINGSSLNPSLGGRILLQESGTAAANAGLVHGAWFEYGLMAQFIGSGGTPSNPLAVKARTNGWLLQDAAGNYANSSNSFAWMNPLVPEVRNLVKGIVVDAIDQFNLQVVQFDDHLAWPVQFGYDDYTRNAYRAETGRNLPNNYSDSRFVAWRQGKMQEFVTELVGAIRAADPEVVVSLSPSVASFSAANYLTTWPDYMAAGLLDEVVPQVYRSTYSSFASEWVNQINAVGGTEEMAGGLRLLGSGAATSWSDLEQMINDTREDNALGHSIWYSEGVSNSGSYNPSANYNSQLTAYYDVAGTGAAANPHFTTVRWAGADGLGGSGTWSTAAATWKDRSPIWVRDARGIFDGSGGTVTVSGTLLAGGGLEFAADGYTLSGGTLQLSGFERADNTISVVAAASTTINTRLIGTAGLQKTGQGTLVLTGPNGSLMGGVDVAAGTLRLTQSLAAGGGTFSVASGARLVVDPGVALRSSGVTLSGGTLEASVLSLATTGIASLTVEDGAIAGSPVMTVAAGGRMTLPAERRLEVGLSGLVVGESAGGLIDLGSGQLTIAAGGMSAADLRTDIAAGRNGGSWDGSGGITSSAAAASGGSRGVGYTTAGDGSLLVSFAAFGDTDLSGQVNVFDLLGIDAAGVFGTGQASDWSQGDFNYDGVANVFDLLAIDTGGAYGQGSYFPTAPAAAFVAAVPEPSGLAVASGLLAAAAFCWHRRR